MIGKTLHRMNGKALLWFGDKVIGWNEKVIVDIEAREYQVSRVRASACRLMAETKDEDDEEFAKANEVVNRCDEALLECKTRRTMFVVKLAGLYKMMERVRREQAR